MKKSPQFIFSIYILGIFLVAFYSCNNSNEDYTIDGKIWDVCVNTDFANPDDECTYLITYVLDKDGTCYEYSKSASDSIQKIQSSRQFLWKLDEDSLTFNVKLERGERVVKHKIKWKDKSTFYTTETNSMDITIETWYTARD